jgi:hypothetical protein
MLHGPLLAAAIVAAWVFLACVVAPLVGKLLKRRQPPAHCKHTLTPGGH